MMTTFNIFLGIDSLPYWKVRRIQETRKYKFDDGKYSQSVRDDWEQMDEDQHYALQYSYRHKDLCVFESVDPTDNVVCLYESIRKDMIVDLPNMILYQKDVKYEISWFGEHNPLPDIKWEGVYLHNGGNHDLIYTSVHEMDQKRFQSFMSNMIILKVNCFSFHGVGTVSLKNINLVMKSFDLFSSTSNHEIKKVYAGTITTDLEEAIKSRKEVYDQKNHSEKTKKRKL